MTTKSANVRRRVIPYKDAPAGAVFKVLKEQGFPARPGLFTKMGNSHATGLNGDSIFALSDVVRVVKFPDEAAKE